MSRCNNWLTSCWSQAKTYLSTMKISTKSSAKGCNTIARSTKTMAQMPVEALFNKPRCPFDHLLYPNVKELPLQAQPESARCRSSENWLPGEGLQWSGCAVRPKSSSWQLSMGSAWAVPSPWNGQKKREVLRNMWFWWINNHRFFTIYNPKCCFFP